MAITDYKPGYKAKLYRMVSSAWTEVSNIKDLQMPMASAEIDFSNRGGAPFKQTGAGLIDLSLSFSMVWSPADTHMVAFRDAQLAGTTVEMAVLSGPIPDADALGFRAKWTVLGFNKDEPLEGGQSVALTFKPAPDMTPVSCTGLSLD
jgi:hypothetical protein